MKKTILIFFLYLFCGCIPIGESFGGRFEIYNNSEEPVYVYLEYDGVDSLPLVRNLHIISFINAENSNSYYVGGETDNPALSQSSKKITLFFFTDRLLRTYDLKELYEKQLYTNKVVLTEEQLKAMNWRYVYTP